MANPVFSKEILDAIRAEMTKWSKPDGSPVTEVAIVEQGTTDAVAIVQA